MVAEFFRRREPHHPDALPVLDATALLARHSPQIAAIRKTAGIPDAHWKALYLSVFETFAQFVQQLPASEAHHHCNVGGLLEHAIDVTYKTVVLRQGHQLPAGASTEEMAKKRDLWTYAAGMGALLHDIGKPLTDQRAQLFDDVGQSLGQWNPWAGPMPCHATHYRVTFVRERRHRLHERVPLLMAHLFLPQEGLRWLGSDLDVLQAFLSVLGNDPDGAGILGELVRQSDGLSVAENLSGVSACPEVFAGMVAPVENPRESRSAKTAATEDTEAVAPMKIPGPLPHATAETTPDSIHGELASGAYEATHDSPDTETDDDTIADGGCANLGDRFLAWLKDGIGSGRLVLNARNARVHVTTEGLLLVSPAIFKDFDPAHWADAQKRFQKRKLHKKTEEGTNIWMFAVIGERKRSTINGLLIPDPKQVLELSLPEPNPHLSLILHNPPEKTGEPVPDVG